ncbi:MAG TPA: NAD+ synthase [Candidatus Binatia bacterium]|nr:NAD+ synthase [Candidatus Binatia bacterium]
MRIALGQINTIVGDFSGNSEKIIDYGRRARSGGLDLIVFPELSVCGYPPRDLVERPWFVERNRQAVETIARETQGIAVICGLVTPAASATGKSVMNSAVLLRDGRVDFVQSKRLLPTYDVFDEMRNFAPAPGQDLVAFDGTKLALTICEDAWNDKHFWDRRLYGVDPVEDLMGAGGKVLLNISASPFYLHKRELRREMLAAIASHYRVPVAMVNQIGGNDSLVFDGSSFALGPDGQVIAQAGSFGEDLVCFDTESLCGDIHFQEGGTEWSAWSALVLGTRDYVHKCGFRQAVLGLSGGIDSALTACIAVEALGRENVFGVGMPGPYSSRGSIDDAAELARNLGIRFRVVPIGDIFAAYQNALHPIFAGRQPDVTEENIQARIRGSLMMAISNKFGCLLLTTGNKSELGVGYCTLYGDMCGGLAVISDVPKTLVYRLANFVNSRTPVIPRSTIEKPPSAELRPDQKDSDFLPPYDVLDTILEEYVEENRAPDAIAAAHGFELELVRKVACMVDKSEYKRQQAAPGLKISAKAFGFGRRYPIAAKLELGK